jgi:hypothetical protein
MLQPLPPDSFSLLLNAHFLSQAHLPYRMLSLSQFSFFPVALHQLSDEAQDSVHVFHHP